jgi:hypothetical protein
MSPKRQAHLGVMVADLQVADQPVAEIGHRQRFAI